MQKIVKINILSPFLLFFASAFSAVAVQACFQRPGFDIPTLITPLNFHTEDRVYAYHADLLQMVLKKTEEEYGPCKLIVIETNKPLNRIHLYIDGGQLFDTVDSTVNPSRDQKLLPIRFPIYRGFMGYRVMIIRQGDQARFNGINSLETMRSITIGAGMNWYDRKLVQQQNIPTVTGDDLGALYRMLPVGRFDAILRGVHEVKIDELRVKASGHSLESNVVLAYPLPVNFYVRKSHHLLAERLRSGLEKGIADGSFQTFFYQHPLIKETLKRVQLEKRKFLYLCNPTLSRDSPLEKPKYWYKAWPDSVVQCSRHITSDDAI